MRCKEIINVTNAPWPQTQWITRIVQLPATAAIEYVVHGLSQSRPVLYAAQRNHKCHKCAVASNAVENNYVFKCALKVGSIASDVLRIRTM